MNPINPKLKCTDCATTQASRWTGMRKGLVFCGNCYHKRRMRKVREAKRPKVYQWAGE